MDSKNERLEAAAKALCGSRDGCEECTVLTEHVLAAADASDGERGITRVDLDTLTRAMYDVDELTFYGDPDPVPWEKLGPAWRALAKDKARSVVAKIRGDG